MKYIDMIYLGLLFIMSTISVLVNEQGWVWSYPKPQGNTLRDIYIFDDNRAVAVGDVGTIIQTKDGGNSWDVQHHAGGTSLELYGVHFSDADNGWAVGGTWFTNKNVLLKTIDGGATWEEIKTETTLPFNMVHFVNADTGFVVGEDGLVMRTQDGGDTWDSRLMDDYFGVFLDVFRLLEVTFVDDSTGSLVGGGYYGNQIYKTTDCGLTWQWDQKIILPPIWQGFNDICFINQKIGFVVGEFGNFLKTVDGGETWQVINLREIYQNDEYEYLYSVSFTDSLNGCIVGSGFVLETSDGGQNWIELDLEIGRYHSFKIRHTQNGDGWIVGANGLIYHKTAHEQKWFLQSEPNYEFNSIHFVDEYTGWAVGEDGVILHTTDGGESWGKQHIEADDHFFSVFAVGQTHAWAAGGYKHKKAVMAKTINGGQNWAVQTIDSLRWFNDVFFIDSTTGWTTCSVKGGLYKTIDGGRNWFTLPNTANLGADCIQFIDRNIGWARSSYFMKTTDGGGTWIPIDNGSANYIKSFVFVNEDIGWGVRNYRQGHNIYKTNDGGKTWVPLNHNYVCDLKSVSFLNENTGWTVGYNNGERKSYILKTTTGGSTWHRQTAPTPEHLTDVFAIDEKTAFVTGTGIIKTTTGGDVSVKEVLHQQQNNIPTNIRLYQNYPNPFNSSTTIEYQISTASFVTLKIYDIMGREIETLVNRQLYTGIHQTTWNASQSASGIYLCCLEARPANKKIDYSYTKIKKMVLIR